MVLEFESGALTLMKYMQVPIWKACHCELRGSYTSAEACFLDKYIQFLHDECKISSFDNESKVLIMNTQECTFSIKFWDIEWLRKVLYSTGIEH